MPKLESSDQYPPPQVMIKPVILIDFTGEKEFTIGMDTNRLDKHHMLELISILEGVKSRLLLELVGK